jgi:lipid-A-disaccharide synthase-like uncharacterized protein
MFRDSGFLAPYFGHYVPWLYAGSDWWTLLGFVASFMFSMRFVTQWYLSERHRRIVIPLSFWFLSFFGSLLQLIYLFHLDRAPLILSYVFLPFINLRSLIIHLKNPPELESLRKTMEANEQAKLDPGTVKVVAALYEHA